MAISLLDLPNGHLSLEFDEADRPRIIAAIHALFGDTAQRHSVMASEVSFGGASFIYQNEWDDPCLISVTSEGSACLRRLYAGLTGSARPTE